jgi:cytochrome P450
MSAAPTAAQDPDTKINRKKDAPSSLPPGPRFAPLQTYRYFRDPYGYYERMLARYGELFTMPTMNGRLVIVSSPDGARELLEHRELGVGFGFEAIAPLIGEGSMLLTHGERHRRDRKAISPSFHGQRMRAYAPAMQASARRELETWLPGREFVLREAMENISLEVIIRAVFGVTDSERVKAFQTAIREAVLEVNPAVLFFKFLQRDFFGPWRRLEQKLAHADALIFEEIAAAREASPDGRDDMLSRMIAARYEDGQGISDQALRDQLVTFLLAGHETTATTLAWAFAETIESPAIRTRLLEELATLGPDPAPEAIAKLPYLDAFVLETLRCHPILPEFFRKVVEDDCEFRGHLLPKGTCLAGNILMIHRDPELYPDPLAFRPERFLERSYSPHEFLTFGGGHRRCIGAMFATQEIKLVLASILPRVELESGLGRRPETVRRNGTLAPEGGVPVRLKART